MSYVVHQYASLHDAIHALTDGVQVFAINLDSFETIYEIEYHSYNDLMTMTRGHRFLFIGIEMFRSLSSDD